jgi:DNA-binding transcriptional LysR family regulator
MTAITLQQLRVLSAVVEQRSFTRGARALHMTQSAASQHIRSLEQALHASLVQRIHGDVLPTRAGAGLLQYAREMLRLAADAEQHVAALRDGASGRLVLGACGSAVYLVPGIVSAFRAAYPQVQVELRVADREALCDTVASGAVEVALLSEPMGDARLEAHPAGPDRLVLVASPAAALVVPGALAPLPLERIAAQPLIAPPPGSLAWELVARAAGERGLTLRPSLRLESPEAIKKAVEAGLGVAFLSAWVVEREVALGTLRVLPTTLPPLTRRFVLAHAATRPPDALLRDFLAFVPNHLARVLPPPVLETVTLPAQVA